MIINNNSSASVEVPADIQLPLKAQRNWECYLPIDEADPEQLAQPFVRIVDANGNTVTTAHDLFEFRPGHAEFIVAACNAVARQQQLVDAAREVIRTELFFQDHPQKYAAQQALRAALAGATVACPTPKRAPPAQQRKALEIAHLFTQAGIGFVPTPVATEDEFDRLAQATIARLEVMAKAVEQEEGSAA